MNVSEVTLNIGENSYTGEMVVPDETSDRGILVIPGASHGPFGDVFDRLTEAGANDGHVVARFETWTNPDDLSEKTEADFEAEIRAGVEFLRSQGCSTISIVAKSFGGRLALTHLPEAVDRLVLWAPAILFGAQSDTPSITADELADIELPVRILQGDEDDVVDIENAVALSENLPNGEVVELPGEDHSFLHSEADIIEATMSFL
ncbi:hypothetical protein C455_11973 [Haloferax larsenii JCM 13917]|nr:dienelactone hydrolase family protein [Haloferax larsenii]ELZ78400.1 hypothetical protein C455_11973 [Haloferax larsenii JCM 13917]